MLQAHQECSVMLSLRYLTEYKTEAMTLRNDNLVRFIATAAPVFKERQRRLPGFSRSWQRRGQCLHRPAFRICKEVIERFEFDSIYHAK